MGRLTTGALSASIQDNSIEIRKWQGAARVRSCAIDDLTLQNETATHFDYALFGIRHVISPETDGEAAIILLVIGREPKPVPSTPIGGVTFQIEFAFFLASVWELDDIHL